jgi:microtubule-associated protein-like 6
MDDEAEEEPEAAEGDEEEEGIEDGDENIGLFAEEDVGEGDERMAVDPWRGQLIDPSDYEHTKGEALAPNENIELHYAHGFRSFDTRNNLKYCEGDKIAYTTAALGVVLDKSANTQQFFNGHDDDIVAMDIHPDKSVVATGQMAHSKHAKMVELNVWSTEDFSCVSQLKGFHRRAIRTVKFSPNGEKLLSIGDDNDHSVAIYDWAKGFKLCSAKVDGNKVISALWKSDSSFVTCGDKHVKFWDQKGSKLTNSKGLYGKVGIVPVLDVEFAWGKMFSGTSKGFVIEWNGRNATKKHLLPGSGKKAIWSVTFGGDHLICGADDGKIHFLGQDMRPARLLDIGKISSLAPGIRALDWNSQT